MEKIKNIIIIGAGGFGREVYSYILDDKKKNYLEDTIFKGFIDDNEKNFQELNLKEPYLGTIDNYHYEKDDYVIVAIGNINIRNKIISKLEKKEINFFSYIHHSVFIAFDATLEGALLICPHSMIQSNAEIKKHSVLNIYCSIGHDSTLGEHSILSPYCTLNGGVNTGKNLFMGTRSTLLLQSSTGDNCIIAAHSVIKGKKGDNLILKTQSQTIEIINRFI